MEGRYYLEWKDPVTFGEIPPRRIPTSLIQQGDIPADAKTLQFGRDGGVFSVKINGNEVPLYEYSQRDFRADVSAYAGQNVELRLDSLTALGATVSIDAFSFSTVAIPEPSTWALLAVGGMLFMGRYWRSAVRNKG